MDGTIRLFKSDWVKNYVCWNSASIIFHLLREAVVHPSFTTKICFSHIGIFALEVKDLRKLLYYSSGEISYPSARKKLGILFYKQRKKKKQLQFHKKAILAKKRRDRDKHPLLSVTTNSNHLGYFLEKNPEFCILFPVYIFQNYGQLFTRLYFTDFAATSTTDFSKTLSLGEKSLSLGKFLEFRRNFFLKLKS